MTDQREPQHPYDRFLDTTEGIVQRGVKAQREDVRERARQLASALFEQLRSDDALLAMKHAFAQLKSGRDLPSGKGEAAHALLVAEIEFFAGVYANPDREGGDRAFDDAGTVKDSIEDILRKWLPEWLEKPLKILNELLRLLRP